MYRIEREYVLEILTDNFTILSISLKAAENITFPLLALQTDGQSEL